MSDPLVWTFALGAALVAAAGYLRGLRRCPLRVVTAEEIRAVASNSRRWLSEAPPWWSAPTAVSLAWLEEQRANIMERA